MTDQLPWNFLGEQIQIQNTLREGCWLNMRLLGTRHQCPLKVNALVYFTQLKIIDCSFRYHGWFAWIPLVLSLHPPIGSIVFTHYISDVTDSLYASCCLTTLTCSPAFLSHPPSRVYIFQHLHSAWWDCSSFGSWNGLCYVGVFSVQHLFPVGLITF